MRIIYVRMRVALSFWITTESIIEVNIQGSTYVLKRTISYVLKIGRSTRSHLLIENILVIASLILLSKVSTIGIEYVY